ncbi:MAG: MaoC/PaaZ C-terminal domain-containing protein [Dehalococcoidia bacterium]
MPEKAVCWEDVAEGQSIGSYSMVMTAVKISGGAWATRDTNPIHHDKDFALKAQQRDMIVNIMHSEGILSRLATDWTGPEGELKKTRFNIEGNCCVGDTMTVTGSIIRKWVGGDEEGYLAGLHLVELQVNSVSQEGPFCNAQITMALPSKAARG